MPDPRIELTPLIQQSHFTLDQRGKLKTQLKNPFQHQHSTKYTTTNKTSNLLLELTRKLMMLTNRTVANINYSSISSEIESLRELNGIVEAVNRIAISNFELNFNSNANGDSLYDDKLTQRSTLKMFYPITRV